MSPCVSRGLEKTVAHNVPHISDRTFRAASLGKFVFVLLVYTVIRRVLGHFSGLLPWIKPTHCVKWEEPSIVWRVPTHQQPHFGGCETEEDWMSPIIHMYYAYKGHVFLFFLVSFYSITTYSVCISAVCSFLWPESEVSPFFEQYVEWQETLGDTQQLASVQPCVSISALLHTQEDNVANMSLLHPGSPGCPIKVFLVGQTSEGFSCQLLRDQRPTVESTFPLISGGWEWS